MIVFAFAGDSTITRRTPFSTGGALPRVLPERVVVVFVVRVARVVVLPGALVVVDVEARRVAGALAAVVGFFVAVVVLFVFVAGDFATLVARARVGSPGGVVFSVLSGMVGPSCVRAMLPSPRY